MSDGNFNTQLLPKTELSSGLRAGRAQMRVKAEAAFNDTLDIFLKDTPEEVKAAMRKHFMQKLR